MWPFQKRAEPARSEVQQHMASFKEGQVAYLCGREVKVVSNQVDDWHDAYLFPELVVAYWDDNHIWQTTPLYPREVFALLTHLQN